MVKKSLSSRFDKALVVFAWLIIAAAIILAVRFYFFASDYETTNNAQIDQYVTPVASRVEGFIQEIRFDENQFVHKGDTLLLLDKQEYVNKLQMAAAEIKTLENEISVHLKSAETAAKQITVHEARLQAAQTKVWQAEKDYIRFKDLYEKEAATRQQFEQAQATYDVARADFRAVENEQEAALLSSHEISARVEPIRAKIEAQKAVVQNVELYISYTVVKAPYDGWVGRKNIQAGQLVKAGETLLNMVSREMWVTANFRETQIAHLHIGGEVNIIVDAYPDKVFKGEIESKSPASGARFSLLPQDNSTGNFVKIQQRIPLRIKFLSDQDTNQLIAGMNVVVNARKDQD